MLASVRPDAEILTAGARQAAQVRQALAARWNDDASPSRFHHAYVGGPVHEHRTRRGLAKAAGQPVLS